MSKQRINIFGGRTHSTRFSRIQPVTGGYGERIIEDVSDGISAIMISVSGTPDRVAVFNLSGNLTGFDNFSFSGGNLYISGTGRIYHDDTTATDPTELVTKGYVDSMTGGGSGGGINPISGSSSSIVVFVGANSASGFADLQFDDSLKRLSTVSASVSSIQIHRQDYQYTGSGIPSILRNKTENTPIWDVSYFDRSYKEWSMSKYPDSRTNMMLYNMIYSLLDYSIPVTLTATPATVYNYSNHKTNATINSEAGYSTNFGTKKKYLRQGTFAIQTGLSTDVRYYIGFVTSKDIMGNDFPGTYDSIAFRAVSASANWTAFCAQGGSRTIVDTGYAFESYKESLFRIQIDSGFAINFFIDNQWVANINSNVPSDSTDLFMINRVRTTNAVAKDLGISHISVIYT
jgi:hypothetical protein